MVISDVKERDGITLQGNWRMDSPLLRNEKDAFRMLFCQQGNATVRLNQESHELGSGCLLICFPGDAVVVARCDDTFTGCYLSVSQKLMGKLYLYSSQSWKAASYLRKMPLLPLEDYNIKLLLSYLHLLEIRLWHPVLITERIGLHDLLSTFICDCVNIAAKRQRRQESSDLSAANLLFNKFVHLLHSDAPQKKGVEYYADKLCVTPKYLSTICKQVAGETAYALINKCLMTEIRNQLTDVAKPIQSIADELGFANQSFFGKFVKAHLGMSASQFRESRCYR